jgi:HSP20 family protein
MASDKSEITRRKALSPTRFDDIFEGFRKDMEDAFFFPTWSFPGRRSELLSDLETRLPLCDMEDLGDKYEVTLEAPGIPKDKINVKVGTDYIDISGEQEKKTEEKRKNYLYNERSYSSLRRRISTPEEIDPSKTDAKMENGVLHIQVPKKTPTQSKETKVEVK